MLKNPSIYLMALVLCTTGCRKSDRDYDSSIKASTDEAYAQNFAVDIFRLMDDAARMQFGVNPQMYTGLLSCAGITFNGSGPYTMSINYGSSGCTGPDGRFRSGKLEFTFSDSYLDSGNVITITPVNYVIQDYEIDGDLTIKNLGVIDDEQSWKISTSDLKITYPNDEDYLTWSANLTWANIEGSTTQDVTDDIYQLSGTTSGKSHSGNTFSSEVDTPLIFDMGCEHLAEGVTTLIPQNLQERVIDYGDGSCDTTVVVTINGIDYAIGLK